MRVNRLMLRGWLLLISGVAVMQAQPADSASTMFFHLSAGLGVDAHSAPSIIQHINDLTVQITGTRQSEFSVSTEFFVAPEVRIADEWSVGVEYSYLIKSYTISDVAGYGSWEFSYSVHMPTAVVHYLIGGTGFWLKAGGGIGYYVANFSERYTATTGEITYSAKGPGVLLNAYLNSAFDQHFLSYIGVDLRWSFAGTLKDAGGKTLVSNGSDVGMSFFNAGVKFGVAFQF